MSRTNSKPRLDPRTEQALKRLQGHPDYRAVCNHIGELAEYHRELLVTTTPADFMVQQGHVRGIRDIHDLLTKDTP